MNRELAEHISLLAAPILAALCGLMAGQEVPAEKMKELRQIALQQAHALWLDTLDYAERDP